MNTVAKPEEQDWKLAMVSVLFSDVRNRYNPVNFEGHEVRMTIIGESVLVGRVKSSKPFKYQQ